MFENLKNLSKSMASECDLIKANIDRVAIPLAGMLSISLTGFFVVNMLFRARRQDCYF